MDENSEIFLNLNKIFSYLNATPSSRCVCEGEQILNAKHLILCGIRSVGNNAINVFALCLQSSALQGKPHEISGQFMNAGEKNLEIKNFKCSCKAGLSGTCKHIAAVLLKSARGNVFTLEKISSTDIKCYWKQHTSRDEYLPCPLNETKCLQSKYHEYGKTLTDEENNDCFNILVNTCATSAQSKHLNGRRQLIPISEPNDTPHELMVILSNISSSCFLKQLNIEIPAEMRACCLETYKSLFNAYDIIKTALKSKQGSDEWKFARQFRITVRTTWNSPRE